MKHFCILFVSIIVGSALLGQSKADSLIAVLKETIADAPKYDAIRTASIDKLKKELENTPDNDLLAQFRISSALFDEYRSYNYDSAFFYTSKMQKIGSGLKNATLIATANLNYGFILLSSGMFKESIEVLSTIKMKDLPDSLKPNYYSLLARYYYDLSDYNYSGSYSINYNAKAGKYIDSALILYQDNSFKQNYFKGLKNYKNGNYDTAIALFKKAIQNTNGFPDHNYALTTSTLSGVYMQKKMYNEATALLLEAAISDIRSSTKETTALSNVSGLLFDKGDISNALICIEKANTDALFYGARQRKIQIGAVLPRIEGQFITTIESQKQNLEHYAIIVTVLFVIVIALVLIIYKQLKNLRVAKNLISAAHLKEKEINQLLNEANAIKEHFNQQLTASNFSLKESNKIKEEYIGYFFHIDYDLLEKFEKFKSSIEKKLTERKFDEIRFIIQKTNIKKEKSELLITFDKIFVKLFPNFVKEFNSLFSPENQIVLKDDEVLNTELRIFALIRMGISDNEKIAQILDYSVNTIYTYKTKIRNRSLVSNDEFDQKLYKATNMGS